MTVEQIYAECSKIGITDVDINEAIQYLQMDKDISRRGTCASCSIRTTTSCPWPKDREVFKPVCLAYIPKSAEQ